MTAPHRPRHATAWRPAARWGAIALSGVLAAGLLGLGAYLLIQYLSGPVMDPEPSIGPMGFLFGVAGALLGPTALGVLEMVAVVLAVADKRIGQLVACCVVLAYVAAVGPWAGVLVFYSAGSDTGGGEELMIVAPFVVALAVAAAHLVLYLPNDRRAATGP